MTSKKVDRIYRVMDGSVSDSLTSQPPVSNGRQMGGVSISHDDLRVVFVCIGDTGADIVLRTGLMQRLPTTHKTFTCFNTDQDALTRLDLPEDVAALGVVKEMQIPAWAGENETNSECHDDHLAKRKFVRPDRSYRGSSNGAEGRHEGALAWIEQAADTPGSAYDVVLRAIERVGQKGAGQHVTVHLIVTLFAGRGSGSGALPVFVGMLGDVANAVAAEVNLRTTIAAQTPTVRVHESQKYHRRTVALFGEVTALAERAVMLDAERRRGGWFSGPPWEQFLVFGSGAGSQAIQRGIASDVDEAKRYAAAVLYERLAGCAGASLSAESPRRAHLLVNCDSGTLLPRSFAACGFAELVYEPEPAIMHAGLNMEQEFFHALGRRLTR